MHSVLTHMREAFSAKISPLLNAHSTLSQWATYSPLNSSESMHPLTLTLTLTPCSNLQA